MNTAALPNLKELYRDETLGVAAVDMVGEKFYIHSELKPEALKTKEGLEKIQQIGIMIDEAFRNKGIPKIYTFAETEEQYRFNIFLGWTPTGGELEHPNMNTQHFYEFEKVLI